MLEVFRSIWEKHDPAILLIALVLCAFGTLISLSVGRWACTFKAAQRRRRLAVAGVGTGLTIWSTHIISILAYQPGVEVRLNAITALGSAVISVALSIGAWLMMPVGEHRRGWFIGFLMGIALCVGHFLDMSSVRVDGIVLNDSSSLLLAIAVGIPFCILAGVTLRGQGTRNLLSGAACFALGVMLLHLIAMSAIEVVPTVDTSFTALNFDMAGLTLLVVLSAAVVFLIGAGLALHDLEVARVTALDRERLKVSEEHHRFSVELNPQIPWIANAQGELLELSPRWTDVVGQPVVEGLGHGWAEKVHPDDLPGTLEIWHEAIETACDERADVRYRLLTTDGAWRWFRARARARFDEHGQLMKWYGSLEDIHEQVCTELALRASEERYRLASMATNEVIWDAQSGADRIEWSGAVESILGYPEAKFGTSRTWWIEHIHPQDREPALALIQSVLSSDADFWTQEFRFRTKSGNYIDLLTRGYVKRGADRKPLRLVGSLMDITARKRVEADLRWAAHHDPLTRLPNRKLFAMRLDKALDEARGTDVGVGLVVIDVDRFKTINDTLGHGAGDALLQEVGRRLLNRVPVDATIARLGGDEFAIIIPEFQDQSRRRSVMRRIIAGMDEPFIYDGRHVDVSLSVGAARFPLDGNDTEELLKSADLALYASKSQGPGNVRGFEPGMREAAEQEKRMLVDARRALTEEQIVPFYQPQICLRSGRIIGFEALLRWHDRQQGLQLPNSIQAAFHDPRLAPELTNRMLARILADMTDWLAQGYDFGRIAMNGSSEDFRRGDLTDRLLGNLSEFGLPPDRLELEVTETVLLGHHAEAVENALRTLRQAGVRIALDDFGTGYASLIHLKQFPVDVIKIDRSFVSRLISEDQQDALIVGALIDLAKNLGIETVAEGIETQLQAFMLRRRGCGIGQGYFISCPMPYTQVATFIDGWEPERFLNNWAVTAAALREG